MKKLEFTVKIEGREIGVVAAISPPFDVVEVFGTRARVPVRRHHQRLSLSFFVDAYG